MLLLLLMLLVLIQFTDKIRHQQINNLFSHHNEFHSKGNTFIATLNFNSFMLYRKNSYNLHQSYDLINNIKILKPFKSYVTSTTPHTLVRKTKRNKMLGTSAQGLTMTIPPALTILPETGRVTVTVPWPLLVVLVLAPPACTICAPAKLAAGIVIIPAKGLSSQLSFRMTTQQCCCL